MGNLRQRLASLEKARAQKAQPAWRCVMVRGEEHRDAEERRLYAEAMEAIERGEDVHLMITGNIDMRLL